VLRVIDMFTLASLIAALAATSYIQATVIPRQSTAGPITEAQLLAIGPSMSACNATAPFADECRTAANSVDFVNKGFVSFNVTTIGEKAALLSLMLFETGNFRFQKNQ
jgi:hypothetical protein